MISGRYSIHFDRMGFPLAQHSDWSFAIGLLPVSKYQFERFMIEHGPQGELYTDAWYRARLTLNPRAPWRRCGDRPWELFVTGVERDSITPFLNYLGRDYRLPNATEWRCLWHVTAELQAQGVAFIEACGDTAARPVRHWLKHGLYPLTDQGLLEWVVQTGELSCIGRPYLGLLPNTWSPDSTREVNWELARRAVGFRVVRDR